MTALEGFRVLDMGRAQQAPYAATMLADMGADVIKVEPLGGDFARGSLLTWYPEGSIDAYQLALNHGKRSLAVDYLAPRGREIVLKLAETSDVFLHNFRPGVVEKIGLDYASLNQINSKIVYCNVSGFGRSGPLSQYPAMDLVGQAMGGVLSTTGRPGEPSTPVGVAIADQVGAMMAAFGITVALLSRERSGQGQEVDVCMLDTQLAMQAWEMTHYLVTGKPPGKGGRGHGLILGLWHTFRCRDGDIAIAGVQQQRWPGFCRAIGHPEWISEERFATAEKREQNRKQLVELLDEMFPREPVQYWLDRLWREDQIVSPVWSYEQILNHPHLEGNPIISNVKHGEMAKQVRTIGPPVKLSRTPPKVSSSYPGIGEHGDQILQEIGYSWDDIIAFKTEGIIP